MVWMLSWVLLRSLSISVSHLECGKTTQECPEGISVRGQLSSMAESYGEKLESSEKTCVVWPTSVGTPE